MSTKELERLEGVAEVLEKTIKDLIGHHRSAQTDLRYLESIWVSLSGIREMAHQVSTQDNLCTAEPIFVVQRCRRTCGVSLEGAENVGWLSPDGEEVEPDLCAALAAWDAGVGKEWSDEDTERWGSPNDYTLTGYVDTWENIQPFFTRAGAENYIEVNGHNLRGPHPPRVFVESAYRNDEWHKIRAFLLVVDNHFSNRCDI